MHRVRIYNIGFLSQPFFRRFPCMCNSALKQLLTHIKEFRQKHRFINNFRQFFTLFSLTETQFYLILNVGHA